MSRKDGPAAAQRDGGRGGKRAVSTQRAATEVERRRARAFDQRRQQEQTAGEVVRAAAAGVVGKIEGARDRVGPAGLIERGRARRSDVRQPRGELAAAAKVINAAATGVVADGEKGGRVVSAGLRECAAAGAADRLKGRRQQPAVERIEAAAARIVADIEEGGADRGPAGLGKAARAGVADALGKAYRQEAVPAEQVGAAVARVVPKVEIAADGVLPPDCEKLPVPEDPTWSGPSIRAELSEVQFEDAHWYRTSGVSNAGVPIVGTIGFKEQSAGKTWSFYRCRIAESSLPADCHTANLIPTMPLWIAGRRGPGLLATKRAPNDSACTAANPCLLSTEKARQLLSTGFKKSGRGNLNPRHPAFWKFACRIATVSSQNMSYFDSFLA